MPRLYHTKSRTGCVRCRARRVKCDEVRPVCGGCSRHKVDCIFDRSAKASVSASDKSSPSSAIVKSEFPDDDRTVTPVPAPDHHEMNLAAENRERRVRELHLMHIFIIQVCPTFPGAFLPHIQRTWEVDVPQLAINYEPLMNAMMALTILFISATRVESPIPVDQLKMHRARYLEATLQEHRRAIGIMSREIADAVSFTSVILSLDAFASLRERQLQPYEPPIQWLHMSKGVMNVFHVAMKLVQGDPKAKINIVSEQGSSVVEPSLIFRESNRAKFPYLLEKLGDETTEDEEAYMTTVSYLGAIMTAKEAGEGSGRIARRIVVFPILFPVRFVDLLAQHKPRALIILAHFFAIAATCKETWWAGDYPQKEVLAIANHIGYQWNRLMRWPLEQIGPEFRPPPQP